MNAERKASESDKRILRKKILAEDQVNLPEYIDTAILEDKLAEYFRRTTNANGDQKSRAVKVVKKLYDHIRETYGSHHCDVQIDENGNTSTIILTDGIRLLMSSYEKKDLQGGGTSGRVPLDSNNITAVNETLWQMVEGESI